jgi:hypothetical protein
LRCEQINKFNSNIPLMRTIAFKNRVLLLIAVLVGFTTACKKKNDDPAPVTESTPGYRTVKIDYSTLTTTTPYSTTFLDDEKKDSTVNRNEGRNRLRMFRALASYISTSVTAGTVIDSTTLSNMFANKNAPFTGGYANLNNLDINIKEVTASTKANQAEVHDFLEYAFGRMAYISTKASQTAEKGVAGKSGNYLLDEAGVEWAQVIQKALIGAYQLDYISNVLLNTGLNADNQYLVPGKKYTELEHAWDEAYGMFTFNDIYNGGVTDPAGAKNSLEVYLGSYAWEYNKADYGKLHMAFLKGRAAIVNNDLTEMRAQATIIRNILEKALGGAAWGYMNKATGAPHAFGEGFGFIYSTRFCVLAGANDTFSDGLIDDLFTTDETTFYDVTAAQYSTVKNKIASKFNLQ